MLLARLTLVISIILAVNAFGVSAASPAAATRVSGEATGLQAGVPSVAVPGSPYVQLPPEGGSVVDQSPGTAIGTGGGVGSIDQVSASTTGSLSGSGGAVTSTVMVGLVELFAGVIRATDIRVVTTSTQDGGRASSSATVTFGSLTVAGLAYPDPRPNTRVELPGLGYVVLNEQLVGGDGSSSSSMVARAFRLQVTAPSSLEIPRGTEFIVANVASGVPAIDASSPLQIGPAPTATRARFDPISTLTPLDLSFDNDNLDDVNDNFDFDFDNDNFNDNGAGGAGGAGGGSPSPSPGGGGGSNVVVTVVVVFATPTSTPRPPTSTPRP
jgi:hypothetical protein